MPPKKDRSKSKKKAIVEAKRTTRSSSNKPDKEKAKNKATLNKRDQKALRKGKDISTNSNQKKIKKLNATPIIEKRKTRSKSKEVNKPLKDSKKLKSSKDRNKSTKDNRDEKKKADKNNMKSKSDNSPQKVVKIIKKGKAPVDPRMPNGQNFEVVEHNGKLYHSSLMWTDLKHNNNKYYIIQLLQSDISPNSYVVFNKWGRVGTDGQIAFFHFPNIQLAINEYNKKYNSKTIKGYTEITIDFGDSGDAKNQIEEGKKESKKSKRKSDKESSLPSRTQDLIRLIFNMNMMKKTMEEIGYDAKKMPLGKLSKETIQKGYETLKKIADVLDKKVKGDLLDLSGDFYTLIPHDFGFKHMSQFVINNHEKLKAKLEMLDALKDIEIAHRLLEREDSPDKTEVDSNYDKLKCKIVPLDTKGEEYQLVEKYLKTTHGETHYFSLDVLDAFKIEREGENKKFKKAIKNHNLLFHGSRLTNFVGILSQGLRIAPPEAPASGYMFGKGIYFADMASKSAQYCFSSQSDNTGLLLLCKVALGNSNPKYAADHNANNLPQGTNSTHGLGRTIPDPKTHVNFKGVNVPIGKGIDSKDNGRHLQYNEFIVYDVSQVEIEYLIKVKFKYGNY